jgi:hypothetical protein
MLGDIWEFIEYILVLIRLVIEGFLQTGDGVLTAVASC